MLIGEKEGSEGEREERKKNGTLKSLHKIS
jgi:hypothetical protein